jgi:hypothetical protein
MAVFCKKSDIDNPNCFLGTKIVTLQAELGLIKYVDNFSNYVSVVVGRI